MQPMANLTSVSSMTAFMAIIATGAVLRVASASAESTPPEGNNIRVRVIQANEQGDRVDPQLRSLVRDFKHLKYTSYRLRDVATFQLALGASGQMQLPGGEWLKLTARQVVKGAKLRLDVAIDKLRFKTTVALAEGATLAVGGPPWGDGVLILALTREGPAKK